MRLSCRVQTHPARAHLIPPLLARLDGFDSIQAINDPDPDGVPNAWRSYRACLESTGDATHVLVVQDDAEPCRNLAAAVRQIAARHPDRIVCLFVGGAPPRSARNVIVAGAHGDLYAELDPSEWLPCVATVYPADHARGILDYVDARTWSHGHLGDDHRLGEYIRHRHTTALATVPNLVQHPDNVPSIMGTHPLGGLNPARVSCCFIGDYDPLDLDW